MGMPISVDIVDCEDPARFEAIFDRLRQIDERFSTYKASSEVSRYARGDLSKEDLSPELKKIIKACQRAEVNTDGYFSAWASGRFEPSGYVKGWAIAEAGQVIEKQGFKTYCIGAGGDILARSDGAKNWNIGIQDPFNPTKMLNKVSISNGAICTSGNYARGFHIINPKTKKPADYWASVTIVGPDIITADILATACFAAGSACTELINKYPDYEILIIDAEGRLNRN